MTVMAAFRYREGKRVGPVEFDAPKPPSSNHSEFVWIGLLEPLAEELHAQQERFDLHPLSKMRKRAASYLKSMFMATSYS